MWIFLFIQNAARVNVPDALHTVNFGPKTEKIVRVNGLSSGLMSDDLDAVVNGPTLPDGILLPKVEDQSHLEEVCYYQSIECMHTYMLHTNTHTHTHTHSNYTFTLSVYNCIHTVSHYYVCIQSV